ncbi:LOW QUALITY PROTEIN: hypothetical protein NC653_021495 [Populus alba x Populus x berolinensis]|uniref:Uncharacterized protein n=1 Tax=Populus alba x Populus x berolinensis TaxID=444605 RepID=A0AAD6MN32_9ROSI|nr:LOW QUALITY PROTEIN: hypothetical protein NC653_021495 [Populus alba x Populus x berolinensis]
MEVHLCVPVTTRKKRRSTGCMADKPDGKVVLTAVLRLNWCNKAWHYQQVGSIFQMRWQISCGTLTGKAPSLPLSSLWLSCSKSQKKIPSFITTMYRTTINENDVDSYTASFIMFRLLPDASNNS